jgi:deoxyribodipyrimidine photo-lyase
VLLQTIEPKLSTELPAVDKPTIDVNKPTLIYNSYNLDPRWRENEDCNRVLLLEPSHFERFPVSRKVIDFILSLSSNIKSCQVMVGEVWELAAFYGSLNSKDERLISKEHPAFDYYPGIKDPRDWIYPEVNGSFNSFFSFWKKCKKFQ